MGEEGTKFSFPDMDMDKLIELGNVEAFFNQNFFQKFQPSVSKQEINDVFLGVPESHYEPASRGSASWSVSWLISGFGKKIMAMFCSSHQFCHNRSRVRMASLQLDLALTFPIQETCSHLEIPG